MTKNSKRQAMTEFVEICEMGPRDGLQNEARQIPTAEKIALVDQVSRCGFKRIEVASFVSPKWVPQMADSAQVMAGITRAPGVRYLALTPNMKGLEAALLAECDAVAVFASASEGFSQANLNASIAQSLNRFEPVLARARDAEIPVRGYISCVVECPFDGAVAPEAVADLTSTFDSMGCTEISLGDTIGKARPEDVDAMLAAVLERISPARLAGHFHDTSGRALDNIDVALARGLRVFDAAVGGLGGCPYAPGAAGNVATEAVLAHLRDAGFDTGLNADCVAEAARLARGMRNV